MHGTPSRSCIPCSQIVRRAQIDDQASLWPLYCAHSEPVILVQSDAVAEYKIFAPANPGLPTGVLGCTGRVLLTGAEAASESSDS